MKLTELINNLTALYTEYGELTIVSSNKQLDNAYIQIKDESDNIILSFKLEDSQNETR